MNLKLGTTPLAIFYFFCWSKRNFNYIIYDFFYSVNCISSETCWIQMGRKFSI